MLPIRRRKFFVSLLRGTVPAAALLALLFPSALAAQVASDVAVQVSAAVQKTPPKITLTWPGKSTTGFTVYRKDPAAASWGSSVAALPGTATTWADSSVAAGVPYEYWVSTASGASGYVASGIELPLVESRGKVVLIVEATYAADLSGELARLEQDLAGDGWVVLRHDVARTETVPNVKALITAEYTQDPAGVKAVFLFGHVPVPYAGAIAPDGHGDHYGAWPADMYYGDMDGIWTDTQDFPSTVAGRQHNTVGDGKFDQSSAPGDIELQVGRVDLADMPSFAPKTELDLLRQYLDKDHNFRHRITTAQRRGLIDDNFGYFGGEAFASSGWRNFSAFFGAANVAELDWFSTLDTQSYLWAYGCGGGWYQGASGVGSTSNFAATDTKAVFTMLFGSYHGDWDTTDNFLRAPLATTTWGLTDAWAGRPAWYFHHMGIGETVGYGARLSQNNFSLYWNGGYRSIHIALMGDPTLRMHVVAPPAGLSITPLAGGVALRWAASADPILGYNIYRASSPAGPFSRLNAAPVAGRSFGTGAPSGTSTYAVRAVALETGSGTYFNASQAIFAAAAPGNGGDFNVDSRADILWRNTSTGQNTVWLMNGTSVLSQAALPAVSSVNWQIGAAADFDGDGKIDILWRNAVTGENVIWRLNGTAVLSQIALPPVFDLNWKIAAAADFDGDGKPDILWRHAVSGQNTIWRMNGTAVSSQAPLPTVANLNWQIGGAADFDADGSPDILWRNTATGENTIWRMNGLAVLSTAPLPPVFDLNWRIGGVGDFTGDGQPDILWRNQASGENVVWQMSGPGVVGTAALPPVYDLGWKIGGPR